MAKPTKPDITIPQGFAQDGQKTDFTQEKLQNGFNPVDPDVLAGDNLNKFIDDTYKGLNYSMNGVDSLYAGAVLYEPGIEYNSRSIVFNIAEDNTVEIYRSLVDNNINNPLSDVGKWTKVEISGGGTALPLLSIRPALYVDESLGLDYYLNGQLLTINSNLQGAVNELKKLKAIRPSLFCTEEEWQATKTLSPNGIVNAFVLDEDTGTLRLPKYPDYIYGGSENAEISVSGNGYGLGLTPDGSNLFMLSKYGGDGNDTNSRPSGPRSAPVPVGGSAGAMGGGYVNIAWGVHPDPAK